MKHEKPAFTPSESSTKMKRSIGFVIAAVTAFLLLGPAISTISAATYYVATNGLDTNAGTSTTSPWLTVTKAAQVMVAGDTTYIRGGQYNYTTAQGTAITPAHSGSPGNFITFAAYQNEVPILDAQARNIRLFQLNSSHSYIRWIGLTMQHFAAGGGGAISFLKDSAGAVAPHHFEIINCTFKTAPGASCVKVHASHDVIFAGCTFSDSKQGIEMAVTTLGNLYNLQAIDCLSYNMNWDGYVSKAQSHTDGSGNTVWDDWCENIYLTGCEAYNCADDGFDLRGRYTTFENCISHDNVTPSNYIDEHGYKFYALDIPVDPNRYHAEYIRCLSYNNAREGFKITSLLDNGSGGSINYVKMFRMINCTSANDDYGISLVTNSTHPMNVEMKNTIVSSKICAWEITGTPVIWAPPPPQSGQVMPMALPSYLTLNSNYNLLYASSNNPINYIGTLYNLPGWQSASGVDLNSVSQSPVFDANYHPTNPACINSGTDVGQPYTGSAPDMGFFESGTITVNCPSDYLTTGENWISIPVAASNDGAYSVFKDLGKWPNSVYHNLYRYNSPTAGFVEYPTYQSDTLQFGKITSGGAYKLMLGGVQPTIHVSGVAVKGTKTITIGGTGTRDFYFGDPFNRPLYRNHCKIKNGTTEVSIDQAISNGWIGNVQHFNSATKSWEAIGNTLQAWHAYKLTAYTAGALQLNIYDLPAADLDGDGNVDWNDLAIMGSNWLASDCNNIPVGNLNSDCTVDFSDYAILTQNWTGGI